MLYSPWLVLLLILSHATPNTAATVRLVNGTSSCSGRVEVLFDGQWGTVCDDDWDGPDAEVVCREVGCDIFKEAKKGAFFGVGPLPVLMGKAKCAKTESRLIDCPADKGTKTKCDPNKRAGVICNAKTRLVNGINSCSGRVEVLHDDTWGTVCDNGWDLPDAAVVCREVGCGDVIEVKRGDYFGQGSGNIWMQDVNCAGNESTLSTCESHKGSVDVAVCDISKNAGVICHSLIRLVNGDSACSGRVEVLYDGQWGTVCQKGWEKSDAAVVCRELGCGDVKEIKSAAYFGQGSGPVWICDLDCTNSDGKTVRNCKSSKWGDNDCLHEKDAGIICHYPVRLSGDNICSGRVEVYHAGQWGTVCDDGWDLSDAAVVCSELGCGDVSELRSFSLSQAALMSNVNCVGRKSTLMSCASGGWMTHTCSSNLHAGVRCRSLKVVNGPSKCSGTLQILSNGNWGAVCHDNWDVKDASVACRELGCSGHVEATTNAYFGMVEQQTWMQNVGCDGNEGSLKVCKAEWGEHLCAPDSHAGVICEVTFKFTMRIEVTGDPAVDPNDPDVGDIILEKIKSKLQADGVFTLSWNTQSNGNIFQTKKKK